MEPFNIESPLKSQYNDFSQYKKDMDFSELGVPVPDINDDEFWQDLRQKVMEHVEGEPYKTMDMDQFKRDMEEAMQEAGDNFKDL